MCLCVCSLHLISPNESSFISFISTQITHSQIHTFYNTSDMFVSACKGDGGKSVNMIVLKVFVAIQGTEKSQGNPSLSSHIVLVQTTNVETE